MAEPAASLGARAAADLPRQAADLPRLASGPVPADRPARALDGERPARGSLGELCWRLERLPPGHPSSPYYDDGTRKAPVTQLRQLELPLFADDRPAEPSGKSSAARRPADHADAAEPSAERDPAGRDLSGPEPSGQNPAGRVRDRDSDPYRLAGPDATVPGTFRDAADQVPVGSGRLTPEQNKIADQALRRWRAAEGRDVFGSYSHAGLTPDMRRLEAELEHGRLAPDTEVNALKPANQFRGKLARLIARCPDSDPATLAASICDGIRYAFLFDAEHHVDGVAQASNILKDADYQLIELRPRWGPGEFQGVNSRWRDPAGVSFEIQWHTPESWAARQQRRAAHERISDPATPLEEMEQLRSYQRASSQVPVPPGAMLMRPYLKDS